VSTHVVRARYGYDMARMGDALHGRWGVRCEKSGLSERKMDQAGLSGEIDIAKGLGPDLLCWER
jgi:hypothetical protein